MEYLWKPRSLLVSGQAALSLIIKEPIDLSAWLLSWRRRVAALPARSLMNSRA